uniref:Uncharacterized protein n=1 Tax=Rhizophora mucronata TaxID=61149 RepID=A0A2P2QTH8_RHIMU
MHNCMSTIHPICEPINKVSFIQGQNCTFSHINC